MAVKVLIKRSIGQEVAPVVRPLIVELRAHAMKHHKWLDARNAQEHSTTKPLPPTALTRRVYTPTAEMTGGDQTYEHGSQI